MMKCDCGYYKFIYSNLLFVSIRDAKYKTKKVDEYSSSESEDETADQKRKRLAQEHLDQLKHYGKYKNSTIIGLHKLINVATLQQ